MLNKKIKEKLESLIQKKTAFVFLETVLANDSDSESILFYEPLQTLELVHPENVNNVLNEINFLLEKGKKLAGFISYEFGLLLETALSGLHVCPEDFPLLWLCEFKNEECFRNTRNEKKSDNRTDSYSINSFYRNITEDEYIAAIDKIKNYIERGETYQINYTFKSFFNFNGDPVQFYEVLTENKKTNYSAIVFNGKDFILSVSPELFIKIEDHRITSLPMKGTLSLENEHIDEKIKAENKMIVDLIRNDLGKISKIGTVKVSELLKKVKYHSLYQVTSKVESILKEKTPFSEILKAILPGGSITGVPKIKAMKIINKLETTQRGIYTGNIGYISKEKSVLNIAIRTILVKDNIGSMGIGSGIVWDSDPGKEYEECLIKERFLLDSIPLKIIETILYKRGTFYLLDLHLKRMERAAYYLFRIFDKSKLVNLLQKKTEIIDSGKPHRFRVLMDRSGTFEIEASVINPKSKNMSFVELFPDAVNSKNIFLEFKTTVREFYNTNYTNALKNNLSDYIYFNEKGEITEGSIYNIILKIQNKFYTPPLSSGLLPGTFREYLLGKYPKYLSEKILHKEDLIQADSIFLINSIRGIVKVELKDAK